ncbi:hypothetical protein [Bacillus pseudomycoides]|uniref:hypothetical protein n=1 Tax=Bacillus pseudomycoides TaxID=64104 RepID=UPI00159BDAFC|nr:hypothetical protein [Bacillus pseudomycoides]
MSNIVKKCDFKNKKESVIDHTFFQNILSQAEDYRKLQLDLKEYIKYKKQK